MSADCGPQACAYQACVTPCGTDLDCTAEGKLCDLAVGGCVECVDHADCPDSEHCAGGRCTADICVEGEAVCVDGVVVTCDAEGASASTQECEAPQSCSEEVPGAARCRNWICTPLYTSCDHEGGEYLETCAEDGQGLSERISCTDTGQVCYRARCRDPQCEPSRDFCNGGHVNRCNSVPVFVNQIADCGAGSYCDAASAMCLSGVCAASEPACDGDRATTCNGLGDGFSPGGTDCASTGDVCVTGTCVTPVCTPGAKRCDEGQAQVCSDNGTLWLRVEFCDTVDTACLDGECVPRQCNIGARCQNGNERWRCNPPVGYEYYETCPTGALCDPTTLACVVPGECSVGDCPGCGPLSRGACCTAAGECGCSDLFGSCQ